MSVQLASKLKAESNPSAHFDLKQRYANLHYTNLHYATQISLQYLIISSLWLLLACTSLGCFSEFPPLFHWFRAMLLCQSLPSAHCSSTCCCAVSLRHPAQLPQTFPSHNIDWTSAPMNFRVECLAGGQRQARSAVGRSGGECCCQCG